MTYPKNLWGDLPRVDQLRTPLSILKEQAATLGDLTDGLLVGEIERSQFKQDFQVVLAIKAPLLNDYRYEVAEARYLATSLYPAHIKNLAARTSEAKCASEEEFELALGAILSSEEVRNAIIALLIQIREDLPANGY